jgi:hypothetical protein
MFDLRRNYVGDFGSGNSFVHIGNVDRAYVDNIFCRDVSGHYVSLYYCKAARVGRVEGERCGNIPIYFHNANDTEFEAEYFVVDHLTMDDRGSRPMLGWGTIQAHDDVARAITLEADVSFDGAADVSGTWITLTGNDFQVGHCIQYKANGNAAVGGLTDLERYFIAAKDGDAVQLSPYVNLQDVITLTASTGSHGFGHYCGTDMRIAMIGGDRITFDASAVANNEITSVAHGKNDNDPLVYMADGNTPIPSLYPFTTTNAYNGGKGFNCPSSDYVAGKLYFARVVDADTLQLLDQPDGSVVSISATTGIHALLTYSFSSTVRVSDFDPTTNVATVIENSDGLDVTGCPYLTYFTQSERSVVSTVNFEGRLPVWSVRDVNAIADWWPVSGFDAVLNGRAERTHWLSGSVFGGGNVLTGGGHVIANVSDWNIICAAGYAAVELASMTIASTVSNVLVDGCWQTTQGGAHLSAEQLNLDNVHYMRCRQGVTIGGQEQFTGTVITGGTTVLILDKVNRRMSPGNWIAVNGQIRQIVDVRSVSGDPIPPDLWVPIEMDVEVTFSEAFSPAVSDSDTYAVLGILQNGTISACHFEGYEFSAEFQYVLGLRMGESHLNGLNSGRGGIIREAQNITMSNCEIRAPNANTFFTSLASQTYIPLQNIHISDTDFVGDGNIFSATPTSSTLWNVRRIGSPMSEVPGAQSMDAIGWTDLRLTRDAAGVLALKDGTNPQEFRVYGTEISDVNAEYIALSWGDNDDARLIVGKTGDGAFQNFEIVAANAVAIRVFGNNGRTQFTNDVTIDGVLNAVPRTETATVISNIGSFLNTNVKRAGLMVWDSTNNRLVIASGGAAGDDWVLPDGSAGVTPS